MVRRLGVLDSIDVTRSGHRRPPSAPRRAPSPPAGGGAPAPADELQALLAEVARLRAQAKVERTYRLRLEAALEATVQLVRKGRGVAA